MGRFGPAWGNADPDDTDIAREETVNGYRICQFKGGGVRVTKGDYWGWSFPGDFEREKAKAEKCA